MYNGSFTHVILQPINIMRKILELFVFEEFLWKVFMMTFCNFVVKRIFRELLSYKEHVGNFFVYEELLGNFIG
jgi:hypothetical protein